MKTIIHNRKANYEYSILDTLLAGIQLSGTEVKSLRDLKASIAEAFCQITNGEIFIKNMHIAEYRLIKHTNHEPLRERKLLLNKKEIEKLSKATKEKGLTIIPLAVKLSDSGFIKVEIGLVKGKKTFDKKDTLKEKDLKRELDRNL